MPRVAKITTCVATLIATAAIGVSPALALGPQVHGAPAVQTITPTPLMHSQPLNLPPIVPSSALVAHRVPAASARTGFGWSAAAIGALAAAAGSIVAIGLVLSVRRRHEPSAA